MDESAAGGRSAEGVAEASSTIRKTSLQVAAIQPFWTFAAAWAALCGALASNRLRWSGEGLFHLTLVFLLVALAWAGLWNLVTGSRWPQTPNMGRTLHVPVALPALPYTRPGSPAGRFGQVLSRLVGWWRGIFWPAMGAVLIGVLLALLLTAVLSILLSGRLPWLNAPVVALCSLGAVQRWRGKNPLVTLAVVAVGLSWLAGNLAFADLGWPSVILALLFSAAVWGLLRVDQSRPRGLWLLDGGQVAAGVVFIILRQPVAASVSGLLLLAQIALQPGLRFGGDPVQVARRTWPWLFASMLVAAWAVP